MTAIGSTGRLVRSRIARLGQQRGRRSSASDHDAPGNSHREVAGRRYASARRLAATRAGDRRNRHSSDQDADADDEGERRRPGGHDASGMTAGQACDPGLTERTPTTAHSGRATIHISAGPRIAMAAAIRASAQVWRDAPCHSSATK